MNFTSPLEVQLISTKLLAYLFEKPFQICLFKIFFSLHKPPIRPLCPAMMSNTSPLRFTATAGTKLVGPFHLLLSLFSQI